MHPTIRAVLKSQLQKRPEIKTGYTVRVHQKIKEGGKERIQQFEGLVIKKGHGEGVENTITVRKVVEGIGVEKIFPLHSKNIEKIVVKKEGTVRREKLYYMRGRSGKSARLTERQVTDEERAKEDAKMEAMYEEAVKAEAKRQKDAAVKENGSSEEAIAEEAVAEESVAEVSKTPEVAESAPEKPASEVPEVAEATPEAPVTEEKL